MEFLLTGGDICKEEIQSNHSTEQCAASTANWPVRSSLSLKVSLLRAAISVTGAHSIAVRLTRTLQSTWVAGFFSTTRRSEAEGTTFNLAWATVADDSIAAFIETAGRSAAARGRNWLFKGHKNGLCGHVGVRRTLIFQRTWDLLSNCWNSILFFFLSQSIKKV